MTHTHVHTHTGIALANPHLECLTCKGPVELHRGCGCGERFNLVCGHYDYRNLCPSWNPVDGCECPTRCRVP